MCIRLIQLFNGSILLNFGSLPNSKDCEWMNGGMALSLSIIKGNDFRVAEMSLAILVEPTFVVGRRMRDRGEKDGEAGIVGFR